MISRSASYAIRAMAFIASAKPETHILSRDIAEALSLPPQFLSKILRVLVEERLLTSRRGKTGGFRLASAAARISLIEIVDPFDRLTDRRRCLLGQDDCNDECACALHHEWRPIAESFVRVLGEWSLADMPGVGATGGGPTTSQESTA